MRRQCNLVGTRSTASRYLAKISGTRWNASPPEPLRKRGRFIASFVLVLAVAGGAALFLTSCGGKQDSAAGVKEGQLYTCGMHPTVIQAKPGNCPVCGMALERVRKQAAATPAPAQRKVKYYKSTMNAGEVSPTPAKDSMGMDMEPVYEEAAASLLPAIDPVTIQNMNIHTARVIRGPLRRIIRTVGVIDYNETALADVTTKFKGWIEKLYVDATGQQVHRGEALFEIYSPELYSAQREYLLALEQGTNAPGASSLHTSARTKLKFFDISDEQIAELERAGQPRKTLSIVAPQDGFVVEKMAVEGQMVDP